MRATGLLQPGSLVHWIYRLRLPGIDASDDAAKAVTRAGARAISAGRLGHPQPQQCVAASRAQCRTLYPVPHHCRPDRAADRRRRRRQCGEKPSRPPARDHRHHEGARRQRAARVRHLSHPGHAAGAVGGAIGVVLGAILPFVIAWAFRRRSFRCRSIRRCTWASWRWRCSMGCSPRLPSRCGRSAAPMTCRSANCSATRLRRSRISRASSMSR